MSGGVSELGGMKMASSGSRELNPFILGFGLLFLIVICSLNALQLNSFIINVNNLELQPDFSILQTDLNILKSNDVFLAQNQGEIFSALVLNDLGASGCQITSQTQIDVNSFAVSLICPVKEVK